ncbi:signal recognition particle, SRP19 subunit [Tribonema minus]|uniref:Signal recognition particle, SRP19 subunit n=1 Tax=Tribonema minus TaxID=303371 RepID=A0A836CKP4_9STRA|nr:signal recognition particle, SRP19 subunit [Tribonema minus]
MAALMKSMEDEQQELPPPPDKTLSYLWPDDMGEVDASKWIVVWPNYIDKAKTIAQGRRVAKEFACDIPIVIELGAICQAFNLWYALEPFKGYPREPYVLGRVRVRVTMPDGTPAHPDIPDKVALLKKMGTLIPNLHIRKDRLLQMSKEKTQAAQKGQAAAPGAGASSKKKGKKGRK